MKKSIARLLVICLGLLLFCSCIKKREPEKNIVESNLEKGTRKITVLFTRADLGVHSHQERIDIASKQLFEMYDIEVERYYVPGYEDITDFFESPTSPVSRTEYYDKLYTEIMAGRGPDVYMFGGMGIFNDLEKKMDSGAFYDLNELMVEDPEFNIDEYEKIIMDRGIYKGKRFIFPLTYSVATLLTSKEDFEEKGFSIEDFSTYDSFISKWEDIQGTDNFRMFKGSMSEWKDFLIHFGWLEECIDYENGNTNFDNPNFERVVRIIREEYRLKNHSKPLKEFESYPEGLFYRPSFITLLFSSLYPIDVNDMLLLPIPNASGKSVAELQECCMISSSTKDPEAAWLLIKTLMSDKCQREMMQAKFNDNVTTKSTLIDEDIETKIANYEVYDEKYIPDKVIVERIKEMYHNYSAAVIPYSNGKDLYLQMEGFFTSNEDQDIDTIKAKLINYYRIHMSE